MVKLNDFLYEGDTVLSIISKYTDALNASAAAGNEIDGIHAETMSLMSDLLRHSEFLTHQSARMLEFYNLLARVYPDLTFIFKGRIKSLIRSEEKFNQQVLDVIYSGYWESGVCPDIEKLRSSLQGLRDFIAYRIIIAIPKSQLAPGEDRAEAELKLLYDIASMLPDFLKVRDFTPLSTASSSRVSPRLPKRLQPYFHDYIQFPNPHGYQSLHINFYDTLANCNIEVQLRTKTMDDCGEIGSANHFNYEKRRGNDKSRRSLLPLGECPWYDEAYERTIALQDLDLSQLDVHMFTAADNYHINDCCGLFRGRLIQPYEHLSGSSGLL